MRSAKKTQICRVLDEKINPILEKDNGRAYFVDEDDGIITIRMEGACATCPQLQDTLELVIKKELQSAVSEVKEVVLDLSVDDDFYEIAKKFLCKKQHNS